MIYLPPEIKYARSVPSKNVQFKDVTLLAFKTKDKRMFWRLPGGEYTFDLSEAFKAAEKCQTYLEV